MTRYDVVIVGGGPSGLSLGHYCTKIGMKVLIIEKEKDIGGCHTVYRNDKNLFSEHSPRVYSSGYLNFIQILDDIHLPFHDVFTQLNFQSFDLIKASIFKNFSLYEILDLTLNIFQHIVSPDHGKRITVHKYMQQSKFSQKSIEVIDTLCRMSDGCTSQTISLNTFLTYINQQIMYKLYEPRLPNDELLFRKWENYLNSHNCTILKSCKVERFDFDNHKIVSCTLDEDHQNQIIYADNFVLAVPPVNIVSIVKNTGIVNAFGDIEKLQKMADSTRYIDYISITYHWKQPLKFDSKYVFPNTEWGIFNEVMSDYMKFQEKESQTVISVSISKLNTKSSFLNKTANECCREEIIQETFRQLSKDKPNMTKDFIAIFEPSTYWDTSRKTWTMKGTGYVSNINTSTLSFTSSLFSNLYNVGTHNGQSFYKPTTFESAVCNSLSLFQMMYPKHKNKVSMKKVSTLRGLLIWLTAIFIVLYILYVLMR
jgi:hypothetical protein